MQLSEGKTFSLGGVLHPECPCACLSLADTNMRGSLTFQGYPVAPATYPLPSKRHPNGPNSAETFCTTFSHPPRPTQSRFCWVFTEVPPFWHKACMPSPLLGQCWHARLPHLADWYLIRARTEIYFTSHPPCPAYGPTHSRSSKIAETTERVQLVNPWISYPRAHVYIAWIYCLVLPTQALEFLRHFSVSGQSIHINHNLGDPFS